MEHRKLEAECKCLARRFNAEQLGTSWVKALGAEFKKQYIELVCLLHSVCVCDDHVLHVVCSWSSL